jgi:hypothetical protein
VARTSFNGGRSNIRNNVFSIQPNRPPDGPGVAYFESRDMGELMAMKAAGEIESITPVQMLKVTFKVGSQSATTLSTSKSGIKTRLD